MLVRFFVALCFLVAAAVCQDSAETAASIAELQARIDDLSTRIQESKDVGDLVWITRSSFAVLTMQYGFAMVETGFVRPRTTVNILFKNFMSTALCGVAFYLTGWALGFGDSFHGLFGSSMFALTGVHNDSRDTFQYGIFNFQFSFAAAATTIQSGAMAERTNLLAYCLLTMWMSGFTYPVVAHWVWHSDGWLYKLGMRDFAGDGPVHLLGGLMALCGTIFLRPRIGRFGYKTEVITELIAIEEGLETGRGTEAEGEAHQLRKKMPGTLTSKGKDILIQRAIQDNPPISSPGYIVFGTIVLWVSWYAFNAGSSGGVYGDKYELAFTATAATTIAACSGGMMGLFLTMIIERNFLDLRRPINGTLAGLVAITGPCAWVQPWEAFVIGILGCVATYAVELLVNKCKIDDPVSAVAVHSGAGIMGLLLCGLFHNTEGLFHTGSGHLLYANFIGVLAIIAFGSICGFIFLSITNLIVKVRVDLLTEMFGIDAVAHHILHVDELEPDILLNGVKAGIDKQQSIKLYKRLMQLNNDKKSMMFIPKTQRPKSQKSGNDEPVVEAITTGMFTLPQAFLRRDNSELDKQSAILPGSIPDQEMDDLLENV